MFGSSFLPEAEVDWIHTREVIVIYFEKYILKIVVTGYNCCRGICGTVYSY